MVRKGLTSLKRGSSSVGPVAGRCENAENIQKTGWGPPSTDDGGGLLSLTASLWEVLASQFPPGPQFPHLERRGLGQEAGERPFSSSL